MPMYLENTTEICKTGFLSYTKFRTPPVLQGGLPFQHDSDRGRNTFPLPRGGISKFFHERRRREGLRANANILQSPEGILRTISALCESGVRSSARQPAGGPHRLGRRASRPCEDSKDTDEQHSSGGSCAAAIDFVDKQHCSQNDSTFGFLEPWVSWRHHEIACVVFIM